MVDELVGLQEAHLAAPISLPSPIGRGWPEPGAAPLGSILPLRGPAGVRSGRNERRPAFAHTRRYDGVAALQTNLSLADSWLAGMASGASAAGLAVQYCMPYAHDILAGAAHAAVTNARATDDYFHG